MEPLWKTLNGVSEVVSTDQSADSTSKKRVETKQNCSELVTVSQWTSSVKRVKHSNLSEKLHHGDRGALAEDERSTDQGHDSPNCEDDSGREQAELAEWNERSHSAAEKHT